MIRLGCIADDITGAADLAGAIVRSGLSTSLIFGVPSANLRLSPDCEAVVIALKSRTASADESIELSVSAYKWLQAQGTSRVYIKYCSTFDSTPKGNIGPVSDALMASLGVAQVVHVPSYPANQRTVYMGHLFVGSSLLSESGMRNHPLTPMRDSNLVRVLAAQTPESIGLLTLPVIQKGPECVEHELANLKNSGIRHVIADTIDDADLDTLANGIGRHSLAAGGAAFGAALASSLAMQNDRPKPLQIAAPYGGRAVIVGSASETSTRQVKAFAQSWPVYRLTTDQIQATAQDIESIMAWASPRLQRGPIMIAADTSKIGVEEASKKYGSEAAAAYIEQTMGRIAICLAQANVRSLIVAGGETSGAVAQSLELVSVDVGPEICPGVPWVYAPEREMAIAFKSGNFGDDDFFMKAFDVLHSQTGG